MKKLLFLLMLIGATQGYAKANKDGYDIKVNIKNCTDSLVYLCHYYGKGVTVYKDDSAVVAKNGAIRFTSAKPIVGGIYILLGKGNMNLMEFLMSNGDAFEISFDRGESIKTAMFKGSEENTNFYKYQVFLSGLSSQFKAINDDLAKAKTAKDTAKLNDKSKVLSDEMKAYRRKFVQDYPNSMASVIFNALEEPEVPTEIPKLADGKKDSTFAYRYYMGKYWEKFNFQDDRIIYSPLYEKKLEDYFKLVPMIPDSFNKQADYILQKVNGTTELNKYSLWWITRYAENSKVMGMDESFVYLVENYYMKGRATWLDDTSLNKYIKRAMDIAPNMIGQTAADIRIPDINENMSSLIDYAKKADFTVLIFYDPTCGHCKKEIPAVDSAVQVMRKNKIDIQIFGIENAQEDVKWKEFIKEHQLDQKYWLHLHDPQGIGNYRSKFDVFSNPVLYLLDRNGKIVGKRIDHSNIVGLVEHLNKQKDKK